MRISDWSSDVCSSDLPPDGRRPGACKEDQRHPPRRIWRLCAADQLPDRPPRHRAPALHAGTDARRTDDAQPDRGAGRDLEPTRPGAAETGLTAAQVPQHVRILALSTQPPPLTLPPYPSISLRPSPLRSEERRL